MKPSTPSPPAAEQSCRQSSENCLQGLDSYLVVVLGLLQEHAALHLLLLVPPLLSHPLRHVRLQELLHILGAVAVDRSEVDVGADGPHGSNFPALLEKFLVVQTLETVLHFHQELLFRHDDMIETRGALLDAVEVALVGVDTSAFIENRLHRKLHPSLKS